MTPAQAGWSLVGQPNPADCPGSGQAVMFGTLDATAECPVCGEVVSVQHAAYLARHDAPALGPDPEAGTYTALSVRLPPVWRS